MRYLGNNLFNVVWNVKANISVVKPLPFLLDDGYFILNCDGVVGADLRAEAVFKRGNNPAATSIVFRVGAGNKEDIQRQPDPVAFYLDVCFFQQIEQPYLQPFR